MAGERSGSLGDEMAAPVRVVDGHHHLWNLETGSYPWLQGPRQPHEDSSGIGPFQHTYLVPDLLSDAAGVSLVASVHVEAAWDSASPVAETRWLQSVADVVGFPHAIIAAVRLEEPGAADILDQHLSAPNVRGVRQMLDWDPRPGAAQPPTLMANPDWLAGLALLAPRGLSFDLQVTPDQLTEAAEVVRAFPDTTFVLNHGGYHVARDPHVERVWREGIGLLAACENACVKTSGYDTVDPSWQPDGFRAFMHVLVEAFGADRTMFASNYPVDGRTIAYRRLVDLCSWALADLTPEQRDSYFAGTAARVYRLKLGPASAPSHPTAPSVSTVKSTNSSGGRVR